MNQNRIWTPHITVATIVSRENRYLIVEEQIENAIAFNQPAGHLEPNETLEHAAIRETLEETQWHVKITGFLGVSRYIATQNNETYIRFTFIANPIKFDENRKLDEGIIRAHWLTKAEISALKNQLRSPLILNDIDRFENGERLPLTVIFDHPESNL